MKITHGSTFSGIGAPEVAAEMLGWENVFHCEINPFGRAVLDYYFPNAESYEDITKTDFSKWRGKITVLTGGFPCQPFSYAGKRRGAEDDRYLWPYMLKCIQEVRPTWFIGENVAGIRTMVLPSEDVKVGSGGTLFEETDYMARDERYVIEEICQQLEDCGYSVQPMLIPACAVGAPHRRDRIFFIAHRTDVDTTCNGSGTQEESDGTASNRSNGLSQQGEWGNETKRTDGLSSLQEYATSERGGEVLQHLQSVIADGAESVSIGRESDVTNTEKLFGNGSIIDKCRGCEEVSPFGNGSGEDYSAEEQIIADTNCCNDESREPRTIQGTEGEERLCQRNNIRKFIESTDVRPRVFGDYLQPSERWRAFPTVSPVYRGNDGIPFDVDSLTIPFSQWKKESLKAYGNAIVVQVIYRIMEAIDKIENAIK